MSEKSDLSALYARLNLPPAGQALVERIRSNPPVRRVQGRRGNVCVRYASQKMGVTIQCESRTVEYPFVVTWEHDPEVLEFWDQPHRLKLSYRAATGRTVSHLHTPDYLLIRENRITFVECKGESDLVRLAEKSPERYQRTDTGTWRCPPGETAAAEYGLGYELLSAFSLSPMLVRNCDFLADYLAAGPQELREAGEAIATFFKNHKQATLRELLDHVGDADAVYAALAAGQFHVVLERDLLCRPESARVYADATYAAAIDVCTRTVRPGPATAPQIRLEVGARLHWDGRPWTIVNVGDEAVTLSGEGATLVPLTADQIDALVTAGQLAGHTPEGATEATSQKLTEIGSERLAIAVARYRLIEPLLANRGEPSSEVCPRTARDWIERYREAEIRYGLGLIGLAPKKRSGNTESRVSPEVEEAFEATVKEKFATSVRCSKKTAYNWFVARCKAAYLTPFSCTTFRERLARLNQLKILEAREGKRAAYQATGPVPEAALALPTHGDRAFELAHIDHTLIEIIVRSAVTGEKLGRLWLTLMIDAYSRKVLAHFLTFDPPSYRSVMMVLRECVRRHGRLPQKIIVDGGADFRSVYFETLLASYEVTKFERARAEPRFGAPIERQLGTTQSELIHTLEGNSQNHSGRDAIWTADALDARLTEWLYTVYPNLEHHGILETPAARFARSLAESGLRAQRRIVYDDAFLHLTLPGPKSPMRELRPTQGIRLHYFDYWAPELALGKAGSKVAVRYDPFDPTYIYAEVGDRWVRCQCRNPLLREYTEREIQFAAEELRLRARLTGRAYRMTSDLLIAHLHAVEEQEAALRADRKALLERFRPKPGASVPTAPANADTVQTAEPAVPADDLFADAEPCVVTERPDEETTP